MQRKYGIHYYVPTNVISGCLTQTACLLLSCKKENTSFTRELENKGDV